ncbi:hypothetical protein ScPMuIL_010889 [Solemya velum]
MPRYEKGILGVRKDPKNQVLFSFSARDGDECPSSDDEDSDYEPVMASHESDSMENDDTHYPLYVPCDQASSTLSHSHKTSGARKSQRKRRARCFDDSQEDSLKKAKLVSQEHDGCISHLPPELWLDIFQHMVDRNGALPFLCKASQVCRTWREIASHPSLWERVDLSYGWIRTTQSTLQWLAENRLSNCLDIDLSSWKKLTSTDVKNLSEKCRHLRCVNFSYCTKLNSNAIQALVDNCSDLEDIDLSFTSTSMTSPSCLSALISACGPKLLQLKLSGNVLKTFDRVFSLLMSSCPNLEVFDISNCTFSMDRSTFVLPVLKFQAHCPAIRVLGLANCNCLITYLDTYLQPDYRGFSKLEQLSLAAAIVGTSNLGSDSRFLSTVLSKANGLKLLDLRGCNRMDLEAIHDIPATDLEQLYMSHMAVVGSTQLGQILSKWAHSLVDLDLSWMKVNHEEHLDKALCELVNSISPSKLRSLNLAGTSVTEKSIKRILSKCRDLRYINLTSCRSLSRGIKREYRDRSIVELRRSIS